MRKTQTTPPIATRLAKAAEKIRTLSKVLMEGTTGAAARCATGAAFCAAVGAAPDLAAAAGAAGAAAVLNAGAGAVGAAATDTGLGAPVGPPGGKVGSLMVGAAVGLGGKLIRTVSFFG